MWMESLRVSTLGLVELQTAVLLLSLLLVAAGAQSDAEAMQDLKKGLTLGSKIDWSNPDPCQWESVGCEANRVVRIQVKNLGMSGSLSPSLAKLSNLRILEFMNNHLSGPLPSLKGLNSLTRIYLHNNNFSSIPADFFDGLYSLEDVSLDNNPFSPWSIPDGLKSANPLKNFSANSANIVGKIPDIFSPSNFPNLYNLHLASNSIQGSLPLSFSNLGVYSLWLSRQSDSTSVKTFNGTIEVLQNMTQLVEVSLNMNALTGPIPDLSRLSAVNSLDLRDNRLTGPVPPSLTKLPSLQVINLTNNPLQGPTPKFKPSVAADVIPTSSSFCLDDPGVDCDSRVNVLISILQPFGYPLKFAEAWQGNDPCTFTGITCTQVNSIKNITIINLQGMNLSGTISPDFAVLTSVESLILSHNNITGYIPDALGAMPSLKKLDLSYNNLKGTLPHFRNNVTVDVTGNDGFGKDSPSGGGHGGGSEKSGVFVGKGSKKATGVVVASVCVALIAGLIFVICVKRKALYRMVKHSNTVVIHPNHSGSSAVKLTVTGPGKSVGEGYSQESSGSSDLHVIETNNMVISIQVLRKGTNNFSEGNILGRGGFGTVYLGELDGAKVAVKRMNSGVLGDKGLAEFKSEIAVLSKVRHRHLVGLLGFCLDGNEKLLVYEYLPQGDLSQRLFSWSQDGYKPLEWKQRLTIALDVARGVEYLHSLAQQSFIHRDLKPSNILLGDDMRAKVADFGLVRLAPGDGKTSIETRLAGTFGYLAPEYAVMGRITTKVDVFSFGVILMEIITGRKALDESKPEDSVHLVTWFRRTFIKKDTFREAIDPTIKLDEETLACVNTVAELAGFCCSREPSQRPEMGHIVNVLSSLVDEWKPVKNSSEDLFGIDFDMSLPQVLKKWSTEDSNIDSSSSFPGSTDNSQTSIPARPSGFCDSFNSKDGR